MEKTGMGIVYNENTREFHLFNESVSYIVGVLKNGQLGQLYYGKRIHERESYEHLLELWPRAMTPYVYDGEREFALEHIKQEYPAYGAGDMHYPAYEVKQENGSRISELYYQSHEIYKGKRTLKGLPATYGEEDEIQSLDICLKDPVIGLEVVLTYSIYEALPVITRSVQFLNQGKAEVVLERAMSMNVDLPDMDFEMLELTGAWSRERHIKKRKVEHGIQGIYSMKGCSSNSFNPFIALQRPETTEKAGEVYGFTLVYSGSFLAQVEADPFDVVRVTMGIHPDCFSWPLREGEEFQTPEAVLVYSDQGLNGMSGVFHQLFRTRLARGRWRDEPRPILINNWEATYFDFDEEKILKLAKTAQQLGIELFVLDDGWFGKRDDDSTSLGDWYPDLRKLPGGIAALSEKIEKLGMKFGLWFEPEMVSEDSDFFRAHPDYVLSVPGRRKSYGRNQYVLDFSREEIVNAIYLQMEKVLSQAKVSYVKWDMNRYMTEVYSHALPSKEQGTVMHRYILGVYSLYERLLARFPHILFESCASGGARFDAGMLYYAPQCWTSDDTDAVERLKIQYGTSMLYPLSSMGAHVSAIPNHQNFRQTPINTRANVAYFGTFGYELDLNQLTEEEKETIKQQVVFMKKYRSLFQQGTFYRLASPFEGNVTAWMVVSSDKKEAVVGYYRVLRPVNAAYARIRLQGLEEGTEYEVRRMEAQETVTEVSRYGDELMHSGLLVSDAASGENCGEYNGSNGDYHSRLYVLKEKV